MNSVRLENLLEKMSVLTQDLNSELVEVESNDFQKMSKSDRNSFLREMEHFEVLLGKADAIAKKTERDALPEIIANQVENKQENKLDNQPTPKKRISNLMKPQLSNNFVGSQKDKNKE